jgi:hypothetical protein
MLDIHIHCLLLHLQHEYFEIHKTYKENHSVGEGFAGLCIALNIQHAAFQKWEAVFFNNHHQKTKTKK